MPPPANHFPDKAALFTAIAVEGFELLAAAITAAVDQAGPEATAGQRLRAAGRAYTGFAVAHPAHFAVMWQRDLLHRDDPALTAAGQATFELLLAGVGDVQAEGWAAGADQRIVAYLAWSVVHGLAALWLGGSLDDDQRPFDELAGEVAALLGRSLAPRPDPGADPIPGPTPTRHPRCPTRPPAPDPGERSRPCTPAPSPHPPSPPRPAPPTPGCGSATPSAAR
jgi:AcrR family transcriptional regulator